jgi:hypothetical protein
MAWNSIAGMDRRGLDWCGPAWRGLARNGIAPQHKQHNGGKMSYKFREGSGFSGDANEAYKELENIRTSNDDKLEPQKIVESASKKKSALHPHFEWDNDIAGGKWRLQQARSLIRAIIYENDEKTESNNVFIHVTMDDGQYYQNISVATVDEFEIARKQLLSRAESLTRNVAEMNRFARVPKQKKIAKRIDKSTQKYLQEIAV